MNFHIITQEKYLQYFNSNKECSLSEPEMEEFLNDIITLCEVDPPAQSPTKIILNIKDRLGCNDNLMHCIHRIVKSDLIEYLTSLNYFHFCGMFRAKIHYHMRIQCIYNLQTKALLGNL